MSLNRLSIFLLLLTLPLMTKGQEQDRRVRVGGFVIEGNRITRDNIIIRELPFRIGDQIAESQLSRVLREAQVNLVNTSLFNFVELSSTEPDSLSNVNIHILVTERWYIWPVVDVYFEDRNLSTWIKESNSERITYNLGARVENFMGMNNTLSATVTVGFQKGFRLNFSNISLDPFGRQYLNLYAGMSLLHSSHVGAEHDKPHFIKATDRYISEVYRIGASYTYRKNVRRRHTVNLEAEYKYIDDTILKVNPEYWGSKHLRQSSVYMSYGYQHDERDYIHYPTEGYYLAGSLRGSTNHDLSVFYGRLTGDFRYYQPLHGRWYASTILKMGVSAKNAHAYVFDRAIGYDDIQLRGYESYIVDGQHYVVNNNTLSFNILPRRNMQVGFLRNVPQFGKIHVSIFGRAYCDMGYAYHDYPTVHNHLSNRFLISGGVGLDIVTFYDIILMFDYAFNREGTPGFFFRVRTPFF